MALRNCICAVALIAAWGTDLVEVRAQDLDAGKTPQQLFSSTCTACHRGPQGLAKGRAAGAVAGFLAQHYTTGRQTASALAGYLVAVGGEAPRSAARQPEQGQAGSRSSQEQSRTKERRAESQRQALERARSEASARAARDARLRRARALGEPATPLADPEPVIVSAEPMPLLHDRALSAAQETRDWAAFAASLAPPTEKIAPPPRADAPAAVAAATQAAEAGKLSAPAIPMPLDGGLTFEAPPGPRQPLQSTATIQPFSAPLP